jgi:hypothetical protein
MKDILIEVSGLRLCILKKKKSIVYKRMLLLNHYNVVGAWNVGSNSIKINNVVFW